MAEQKSWGVTDVTIRYVAGGRTWEISLDPKEIDILVFNDRRYREISAHIGHPADRERHVLPDGRSVTGKPAAEVAKAMGLRRPPRDVGPAESGTSHDIMCLHHNECQWWCMDETHDHEE